MLDKIQRLLTEVEGLEANSAEEIEQLRIKYLSKKGEITALMADFRNVPAYTTLTIRIAFYGCKVHIMVVISRELIIDSPFMCFVYCLSITCAEICLPVAVHALRLDG